MKHDKSKMDLLIEELEERIAPDLIHGFDHGGPQGNNGFGNGGDDGVPGRSGDNPSPNASEKAADIVR